MTEHSELRVNRNTADAETPAQLRHALAAFLNAIDIEPSLRDDIIIAVGEAIANAVEHAYETQEPGRVELHASTDADNTLLVDVYDRGAFIDREAREGRGLGLRIVRAIARAVSIDTEGGTRIRMVFDAALRQAQADERRARDELAAAQSDGAAT